MIKELYPVTIIMDRYSGTYSGAYWLAFNLDYNEIPDAVCGSDIDCLNFWENEGKDMIVGKGASVEEAYEDLYKKVMRMNLTDRQVELIENLLMTYEHNADLCRICKFFWFNNKAYSIRKKDYDKVCEIIDYIKGVKK